MTEIFILILEEDPDRVAPIKAVFTREFPEAKIHVDSTCPDAKNYLRGAWPSYEDDAVFHPLPTLIVLDLWRTDASALGLLEWIARREWLTKIPVITRTASTDSEDVLKANALGVRRYLIKPDDYGNLVEAAREELLQCIESNPGSATASGGHRQKNCSEKGLL